MSYIISISKKISFVCWALFMACTETSETTTMFFLRNEVPANYYNHVWNSSDTAIYSKLEYFDKDNELNWYTKIEIPLNSHISYIGLKIYDEKYREISIKNYWVVNDKEGILRGASNLNDTIINYLNNQNEKNLLVEANVNESPKNLDVLYYITISNSNQSNKIIFKRRLTKKNIQRKFPIRFH
jgi:hypothetical protein